MLVRVKRGLLLPMALALAVTGFMAASQQTWAEAWGRPSVTCSSEIHPEFAEKMTEFMRIAVNVGTESRSNVLHEPGVAFYDYVTHTECYTSRSVHFETGSVVKAIMTGVLLRRPEGITAELRPVVEQMLLSDSFVPGYTSNDAAIQLWNGTLQCGRDATDTPRPCTEIWDFLAAAGMNDTYLADDRAYGDTHMIAYDAVQLFKVFTSPNSLISTERREYAMDLLARTPDRYGVTSAAPPDTVQRVKIGHKKNNDDPNQWISNAVGQVEGAAQGYNYLMSIFTNWNSEIEIPGPVETPSNGPARVDRVGEQLNCGVRSLNGDDSCWTYKAQSCMTPIPGPPMSCATAPLRSHLSQHWVRVQVNTPRLGTTLHWKLVDASNGDIVDEDDVSDHGPSVEKTVYGLYSSYVLLLNGNDPQGGEHGTILNYTGNPEPGSNQPPVVSAGPDRYGQEGLPVSLAGFTNDDQGLPEFHWTASPVAGVDPGATCTFDPPGVLITSITCTDDGVYAIHLSANDGTNDTVTDTARLTLWNVSPTLGAPPAATTESAGDGFATPRAWQVFKVGDPVAFDLRFQDLGSNDTHTCAVNWDDGQTQSVTAQNYACEATHQFTEPGMYTITSTVEDDDRGGVRTSVMVIVYDPDGGFATSGAYLDSPAGALTTAPTASGRLYLQLNPKYTPGDPGPAVSGGKISGNLRDAAFSLDSATLDWLVVTQAGKAAAKGTATVNGESGYGYVVYGYDDPDKLRLVVWRLSEGDYPGSSTVYDNRRGSNYDLDLANPQELSGGSFQAHL